MGVAGYVALLQRSQGQVQLTQRIGVLQDFYIHSMDSRRRQINLSNMARKQEDIYGWRFEGKRYDIGDMLGWLKTQMELSLRNPLYADQLRRHMEELLGDEDIRKGTQ